MPAPTFTLLHEGDVETGIGATLSGANWLHAVNDSGSNVVLSMEYGSALYMARIDATRSSALTGFSWTSVATRDSFSDHWHIFAHGYHWISYKALNGTDLYLTRVATDFTPVDDIKVVSSTTDANPGLVLSDTYSLNDHFMVRMPAGVAVGVWDPVCNCLVMITLDTSLGLRSARNFDPGEIVNTCGSARAPRRSGKDPAGYHILTSRLIDWWIPGHIDYWITNRRWAPPASPEFTISDGSSALMMPVVSFYGDYRVITYRSIPAGNTADYGNIVRDVYDDAGNLQSTEVLHEGTPTEGGHRPHTVRFRHLLLTCWDLWDTTTSPGGLGCWLRVDRIS